MTTAMSSTCRASISMKKIVRKDKVSLNLLLRANIYPAKTYQIFKYKLTMNN